jgi:hypothetical protein
VTASRDDPYLSENSCLTNQKWTNQDAWFIGFYYMAYSTNRLLGSTPNHTNQTDHTDQTNQLDDLLGKLRLF